MDKKHILLLVLVCVVSFSGYLVTPYLAYDDSYAFMSQICRIEEVSGFLGNGLFSFLLPWFPCNFFVIKIVLLSLFIISVLSISVFGENVLGPKGWRAGLFAATLSPLLFMEAMKFENDIFGWTLIFVAFALITLPNVFSKWQFNLAIKILGGLIAFFACFVYSGAILGVLAIGFIVPQVIVLAVPPIFMFFNKVGYLTSSFFGNNLVAEELPITGLVPVALLFVAILDLPKRIKWSGWFLFIAGLIKAKFMIFAIPFLAVGVVEFESKMRGKYKRFPNLAVICLVFVFVYAFMGFYSSYPNQEDFGLIKEGIHLSTDTNQLLYNDWSIGWWITYSGHHTEYKAGFPEPDYNSLPRPFMALSNYDLNCLLVRTSVRFKLFQCL